MEGRNTQSKHVIHAIYLYTQKRDMYTYTYTSLYTNVRCAQDESRDFDEYTFINFTRTRRGSCIHMIIQSKLDILSFYTLKFKNVHAEDKQECICIFWLIHIYVYIYIYTYTWKLNNAQNTQTYIHRKITTSDSCTYMQHISKKSNKQLKLFRSRHT